MYTLANAKHDYKEGWVKDFALIRTDKGWTIQIRQDGPNNITRMLSTARNSDARIFKTLDAAVLVVEDIGWSTDHLVGE